jgi:hypothetical protein
MTYVGKVGELVFPKSPVYSYMLGIFSNYGTCLPSCTEVISFIEFLQSTSACAVGLDSSFVHDLLCLQLASFYDTA